MLPTYCSTWTARRFAITSARGTVRTALSVFGGPERRPLTLDVVQGLSHAQLAALEIDVFERQTGEFAESQAACSSRPDQALEPRVNCDSECSNVVPREQRALDHSLGRGTLDADRIAGNQPVVDGGGHDRTKQPIDLRHRVVVQAARCEPAVPRPHVDGVDVAEMHVGEHRNDVSELALVDLARPRTDRPIGNPPRRVLAERDATGVGIDPDASDHVGLDGGEPASRVGLAGERRVGSDLLAKAPIARLVPAAGQLADVAEGTGSGHDGLLVLDANL